MIFKKETICQHIEEIFNAMSDGIYISDCYGETLLVNKAYEELVGVSSEDLIGKNVYDLVHEGFFNTIVNPDVRSSAKPSTTVQKVNNRTVVLHGFPVVNSEQVVVLVVTFVRDITAFTRLNRELIYQKSLLSSYQRNIISQNLKDSSQDNDIIAISEDSQKLMKNIGNIAPTDATVLLLGETGVGKDVIASELHKKSQRADQIFIKVDCTAIPESLMESELFGYVSGAFSGAHAKGKKGFFEKANYGTLFLDEIGELSLSMQTKLLRAIDSQEIIRLGSTNITPINTRIIAATNRDLEKDVQEGKFRSDLYYRLKVSVLNIKPLRERRDDILPLTRLFLFRYNTKYEKNLELTTEAENILYSYNWPGNVRELENTIHNLVVNVNDSYIDVSCLPESLDKTFYHNSEESMAKFPDINKKSLKQLTYEFEQNVISYTVSYYGSISKAADALRLNRTTLYRKLQRSKYNVTE